MAASTSIGVSSGPLVLGSASPRRKKILEALGVRFEIVVPDVSEVHDAERPDWTVRENALRKHDWCRARCQNACILTADTVVVFEDRCVAKPSGAGEARQFLRRFSGKQQDILTAVAYSGRDRAIRCQVVTSSVQFLSLDEAAIDEYFARVDPMDKAGAYDIDQAPELIIQSYHGSRTNIMGLPVELVCEWLGVAPTGAPAGRERSGECCQ